jgi:hypothetical protein
MTRYPMVWLTTPAILFPRGYLEVRGNLRAPRGGGGGGGGRLGFLGRDAGSEGCDVGGMFLGIGMTDCQFEINSNLH